MGMDLRDLDACLDRAFALTSSDLQREAEGRAPGVITAAGRWATEQARYADGLRGALVGAPAMEE